MAELGDMRRRTKTSHSHPEFDVGYDAGYAAGIEHSRSELERWSAALGGGPTLQARYRTALEEIVRSQDPKQRGQWCNFCESLEIAQRALDGRPLHDEDE